MNGRKNNRETMKRKNYAVFALRNLIASSAHWKIFN